jgi:hypothetical protein
VRAFEQPQLEHVRRIEAVNAQEGSGSGDCRTRRHQPDELGADDIGPTGLRFRRDPLDDLMECGRLVILDVHAHLCAPDTRQLEAECTHARKAAALLAHDSGDRAGDLDVVSRQIHVERDQRTSRTEDHAAGPLVEPCRTEIRPELPRVDASLQLGRPPAPKERRPSAGCRFPVQEDRQLQLRADSIGEPQGTVSRALGVARGERDFRYDVGSADPLMRSILRP